LKHLDANEIVPPYPWREFFEDSACRQSNLGEPWCGPAAGPVAVDRGMLNRESIARFLKSIYGLAKAGFKLVPQAQANARASICAGCPMNSEIHLGCWKCTALLAAVAKVIGTRETPDDSALKFCSACGCSLRIKCHFPKDVLDKADGDTRPIYHENCWMNTEE
jgi:hypothetical protein